MSSPRTSSTPRLANGEHLYSLEDAARLLRVSPATLQARMEQGPRRARGQAQPVTRYLTTTQLERLGKEIKRLRGAGLLSLDEVAAYLEIPEEKLLRLVESGELREDHPGSAFFANGQLEMLQARQQGIKDPIALRDAEKMGVASLVTLQALIRTKWLKCVRIGSWLYVSRSAAEEELRRRGRLVERLCLLQKAGRLLTRNEAAEFLGVHGETMNVVVRQGLLKPFYVKRLRRRYYRRRDIERAKLARAHRDEPPPNTLRLAEVRKALGISQSVSDVLTAEGRLRVVARRRTGGVVVDGYDPKVVERIKAERARKAALLTTTKAARILGVPRGSIGRFMERGLLVPKDQRGDWSLFEPKDVHRLKDDPAMAQVLRRARSRSESKRKSDRAGGRFLAPGGGVAEVEQCRPAAVAGERFRIALSLKEAARYLGAPEQAVRGWASEGKLGKGSGGKEFARVDLDGFLVRRKGLEDPIPVGEAERSVSQIRNWIKDGWLRASRVGRWIYISRSAMETEIRWRERLGARLNLLRKAGRLLTAAEAQRFLGIREDTLRALYRRGVLKRFRPRRVLEVFIRRRDLERVKALGRRLGS